VPSERASAVASDGCADALVCQKFHSLVVESVCPLTRRSSRSSPSSDGSYPTRSGHCDSPTADAIHCFAMSRPERHAESVNVIESALCLRQAQPEEDKGDAILLKLVDCSQGANRSRGCSRIAADCEPSRCWRLRDCARCASLPASSAGRVGIRLSTRHRHELLVGLHEHRLDCRLTRGVNNVGRMDLQVVQGGPAITSSPKTSPHYSKPMWTRAPWRRPVRGAPAL
jgi:hypothetical protein